MNKKNNNNNNYCTECGAKIEDGNYCPECGTKIDNNKENNSFGKTILKGIGITIAICVIIFIALVIFALITGAGNYPDQAYQDNIDNTIHYNIPAGYKHIETKNVAIGGQVLKTATYKNKQGQEITVSKMSEGEMYIMGHGKKVPTGNTIKKPDGSVGVLKQEGNFYMLITADNPNVLNSI